MKPPVVRNNFIVRRNTLHVELVTNQFSTVPSPPDKQRRRYPPTGSRGMHRRCELLVSAQPSLWAIALAIQRRLSVGRAPHRPRV